MEVVGEELVVVSAVGTAVVVMVKKDEMEVARQADSRVVAAVEFEAAEVVHPAGTESGSVGEIASIRSSPGVG